jgi:hypothetical protein
MFRWNDRSIEKVRILAEAGFSASEASTVIGASKASILGRSKRSGEFRFAGKTGGVPVPPEVLAERLRMARLMVAHLDEPTPEDSTPGEPLEEKPTRKRELVVKKNNPHLFRKNKVVEKPLSSDEKDMIFSIEGPNSESVNYYDMRHHHCKWIVSEINGLETMVCGRKRKQGSPYCEHHAKRAKAKPRGRPSTSSEPEAVTNQTDTSPQGKSSDATESCSC